MKFLAALFLSISFSAIYSQSNCDIYCPEDFAVELNNNGQYVVEDYYALGYVTLQTDECDQSASVFQSPSPGTIMGLGEFEVNMTVQPLGESDDCDFDVVVVQQQGGGGDCDFDCPENQVGNVDANGDFVVPNYVTNGALIVTGDCGDFTSSQSPEPGSVIGEGVIEVSITASSASSSISCGFGLSVGEPLGITELSLSEILVYPNPTTNKINISTSVDLLTLTSLTGEILLLSKGDQIDVSECDAGVYILKLSKNGSVNYRRVIIK